MRLIGMAVALCLLVGCGGGLRSYVERMSTKRVYVVEHGRDARLDAFDELEEWVAVAWNSPRDVVHLRKERTGVMVVKWTTRWRTEYDQTVAVRTTGVFKVDDSAATFTFISNEIPVAGFAEFYREWDATVASTPWGPGTVKEAGDTPRTTTAPACRGDRDCERGETCFDGQCR